MQNHGGCNLMKFQSLLEASLMTNFQPWMAKYFPISSAEKIFPTVSFSTQLVFQVDGERHLKQNGSFSSSLSSQHLRE